MQNSRFKIDKREMAIGRDLDADLVLDDGLASRRHSLLVYANFDRHREMPDCRLFDENSTNGTYVNDERVGIEGAWLTDRDRIRIGHTTFGFFVKDEEELDLDAELEKLATRDDLTGLFNRATFYRRLATEFERAQHAREHLSVFLLSVDRFKSVAETYGQLGSESLLKQISDLLKKQRRSSDTLARLGGGKFACLLRKTNEEGARVLAERVRGILSENCCAYQGNAIRITSSVGVASLLPGINTPELLLDRADLALYEAKKKGGNLTVVNYVGGE